MGRSIIQEVTRLASGNAPRGSAFLQTRSGNCMAAGAAKHGAKSWRSTISNRGKVENPGSLISFLIVVRLHVPQPISCGGSSLKTRAGL